ncbi:hypothetical protein KYY02_19460 [Streptomyces pimonensis]|uniref:Uncharacterized protein n=1 Tax=Streptomyces pimonensis TaxID=2860288 RepID=A0ABV4J1I3_9ACTN
MSFRLIVTRPNGTQTQTSADPLPDRGTVGMSALRFLAAENVAFGSAGLAFGRELRDAPLGKTLTHDSGYTFRTEQF